MRRRQDNKESLVSSDTGRSDEDMKYEGASRESTRLVLHELSDLWRATPLHSMNLSGDFSPREFSAALQHLKPGKAPGPDSICPELIIHAGAGLISWQRGFLSSCLRHLTIPKVWRRALVVAIPKPLKPVNGLIELLCDLLALRSLQTLRDTYLRPRRAP